MMMHSVQVQRSVARLAVRKVTSAPTAIVRERVKLERAPCWASFLGQNSPNFRMNSLI